MKMKKITKAITIISISFILLIMAYTASHQPIIMSLLNKANIKYDACIDEVCFDLNNDWLVLYNSDYLFNIVISKIFGDYLNTMVLVKMQGNDVIGEAIYSKNPKYLKKMDFSQFDNRKTLNWGTITILSSDCKDHNYGYKIYLHDLDIFIFSTIEDKGIRIN